MFNVYSIENQNFYLNNSRISGIQSLNISYDNNIRTSLALEDGGHNYFVAQPLIGNIDLEYLLSSNDAFISYTGSSSFSGKIEYGNKYFTFSSGFLTSYSLSYRFGEYPKVNVRCITVGEIGNTSGNFNYSPIGLNNFNIGDNCYADIQLDEVNNNRLESFSIAIEVPREPVYTIGDYLPDSIITKYPININLNMGLSMSEYNQEKITNLFAQIKERNAQISFKKYQDTSKLLTFNLSNLVNRQSQLSYGLNDDAKLVIDLNTYILSGN